MNDIVQFRSHNLGVAVDVPIRPSALSCRPADRSSSAAGSCTGTSKVTPGSSTPPTRVAVVSRSSPMHLRCSCNPGCCQDGTRHNPGGTMVPNIGPIGLIRL
jgi:hypothetical protein